MAFERKRQNRKDLIIDYISTSLNAMAEGKVLQKPLREMLFSFDNNYIGEKTSERSAEEIVEEVMLKASLVAIND